MRWKQNKLESSRICHQLMVDGVQSTLNKSSISTRHYELPLVTVEIEINRLDDIPFTDLQLNHLCVMEGRYIDRRAANFELR
jgi:hypothetical protein